jgi:hypothetical protein
MAGLLEFSHSWEELEKFVKHQSERDWGDPVRSKRGHYQRFYDNLRAYLNTLRRDVKDQYGFVPDALTKKEEKQQTDFFAGLLAQEFVQHLAAEMMWQAWQQKENKR